MSAAEDTGPTSTVLFVCLHGSAKSLIAATHLNRLAQARGLRLRGESSGLEPDTSVPAPVVAGLEGDGIDVRGYSPRPVTSEQIAAATRVITFGCDLNAGLPAAEQVERWDDLPMVSDGYAVARDAIVARVEQLLDRC